MKKNLFVALSLAAIVAATSTTAFAEYSAAGTGVTGSRHDINAYAVAKGQAGLKDSQERVCAFCHTPHHAMTTTEADYLPLWSHDLNTAQSFSAYASSTLNATLVNDNLIGPSRLCMSCHDGVIAVDTHYTNTRGLGSWVLSGDSFPTSLDDGVNAAAVGKGNSLAGDHPIGFSYTAVQSVDPGIRAVDSAFRDRYGNPNRSIKIQDVLYPLAANGQKTIMTCATCHDVHNKDNVIQTKSDGSEMKVGALVPNYFLYSYQTGSQICLSCHDK